MKDHKLKTSGHGKPHQDKFDDLPLGPTNYRLIVVGLVFIAVGFILMGGGGSEDPDVFDHSIFNFRRTTLAPILVLIGYGIEVYAILKKPEQAKA